MRLLIDSNRFIDFCAGDDQVVSTFESTPSLNIPFVVAAEIRAGGLVTKRGEHQIRVLQKLLNQPGVQMIHNTDATTHHYAQLYATLRKSGHPIPTNDIWIAALAIEHQFIL